MIKGTADEQCGSRPKGNKKDQLLNLKIVIRKNKKRKAIPIFALLTIEKH